MSNVSVVILAKWFPLFVGWFVNQKTPLTAAMLQSFSLSITACQQDVGHFPGDRDFSELFYQNDWESGDLVTKTRQLKESPLPVEEKELSLAFRHSLRALRPSGIACLLPALMLQAISEWDDETIYHVLLVLSSPGDEIMKYKDQEVIFPKSLRRAICLFLDCVEMGAEDVEDAWLQKARECWCNTRESSVGQTL